MRKRTIPSSLASVVSSVPRFLLTASPIFTDELGRFSILDGFLGFVRLFLPWGCAFGSGFVA